MRKLLLLGVGTLLVAATPATSHAAIVNCTTGPIQIQANTVYGGAPIVCDGLTFGDFFVNNLTGTTMGRIDINAITLNTVTGEVDMNLNPGLGAASHMDFFYSVTGGVNQIDLSVGGTNATVTERACANPIPTVGGLANLCTNADGTQMVAPLGQLTVHSGDLPQPVWSNQFALTSPVYVFKDIGTGLGGGLSTVNQSFHSTPEPASLALLGTGLLGLVGVARRRRTA